MTLADLRAEIERLDAAATKGPWRNGPDPYDAGILAQCGTLIAGLGPTESPTRFEANRDFIALSRTALPELLRRLIVAEEALDKATNALKLAYARGHFCDDVPCPGCECGYALDEILGREVSQEECERFVEEQFKVKSNAEAERP